MPAPPDEPPASLQAKVPTAPVTLCLGPATPRGQSVIYKLWSPENSALPKDFAQVWVRAPELGQVAVVVQSHLPAEATLLYPAAMKKKLEAGHPVQITVIGTTDGGEERLVYEGTVGLWPAAR
jgi:hypothetical protein